MKVGSYEEYLKLARESREQARYDTPALLRNATIPALADAVERTLIPDIVRRDIECRNLRSLVDDKDEDLTALRAKLQVATEALRQVPCTCGAEKSWPVRSHITDLCAKMKALSAIKQPEHRCPKCGAMPHEPDIEQGRIIFEEWLAKHPCGYQGPDDQEPEGE